MTIRNTRIAGWVGARAFDTFAGRARGAATLVFATGLAASGAAVGPSRALIAAPGECAQPSRELATEPASGLPAGVAGPAASHFAPVGAVDDAGRVLPLDLTRASPGSIAGGLVENVGDTGLPDTFTSLPGGGDGPGPNGPTLPPIDPTLPQLPPIDPTPILNGVQSLTP